MLANANKLMHARHAAHNRPIMHLHMASNLRITRKNCVVTNLTIVCNMYIRHDPIIITQLGNAIVLSGTGMNRGELPNGIAIADL